jgi:S-DNA-T family DNA segregation ATPase FtsK/SpoIIIE
MSIDRTTLELLADRIEEVLELHSVVGRVNGGLVTPKLVRFLVETAPGTKVRKVSALSEEIALALGCREVRIRRDAGQFHIEMARRTAAKIRLQPLIDQVGDVPPCTAVLGLDASGVPLLLRITSADVTHVLIVGTTGSGKTALARTVLASLAAHNRAEDLRLVLIDPKERGFSSLTALPNVWGQLASHPDDAQAKLQMVIEEMESRDRANVSRPVLVVAIDELADLIQTGGKTVEQAITRISQRGREAGIHLIACTQKPSAALIGSAMKANFPVRLVGAVASRDEARYATGITDSGADKLGGKGDFLLVARGDTIRFQAAWLDGEELKRMVSELWLREPGVLPM